METYRAGFWWRTGAMLLDGLYLAIMLLLLQGLSTFLDARHLLGAPAALALTVLGYLLALAYSATEIVVAGTPGKLITGLRIRNLDGTPAPRARLLSRWTAKWSYLLIGMVGLLLGQPVLVWLGNLMGYIVFFGCFAAAGEAKLAWHDRWAQTAVCRVRRRAAPAGFEPVIAGFAPESQPAPGARPSL